MRLLLVCSLVLQYTLAVSIQLDEVEKLLEDATNKLKLLKEKDAKDEKESNALLNELEDFKIYFDGFCAEELARISTLRGGRLLVGGYVPQCSTDGRYKSKQCHPSTGYCWCVNVKDGEEIHGTRTRGYLQCAGAASNMTTRNPSAKNGWSVGVTGGHSRRQGWHGGIEGRVTWGKDEKQMKPAAKNKWSVSASVGSDKDVKQTKPTGKNGWSIGVSVGKDAKQSKPLAGKNSWSVSASVGSGKDAKQTKPTGKNGWSIGLSVGKDAKQSKPLAGKNSWSVGASVGSDKDAQQLKPVGTGNAWRILCDMTMKKSKQAS